MTYDHYLFYRCIAVNQSMQQAVKWGGRAHCDSGANGRPAQAKEGRGKLTGVSRNSGWGFGAVEIYYWWDMGRSWTWTHKQTNKKRVGSKREKGR